MRAALHGHQKRASSRFLSAPPDKRSVVGRAVTSVHRVDLVVSNRLKNIKPATPKRTPAKQANQLCVESLSIQPYEIAGEVGRVPDVVDGRNERKDKENTKPSPKRVSNSISNFLRPVSPAYVLDIKPNRTEYAPSSLSIELFQGSESGHVSDSTSTPPPNLESHEAVWEQHCVNTWREVLLLYPTLLRELTICCRWILHKDCYLCLVPHA